MDILRPQSFPNEIVAGVTTKDIRFSKTYLQKGIDILCSQLETEICNIKTLTQVHGGDIVCVDQPEQKTRYVEADAIVTQCKGVIIGIKTADCIPILLYDPYSRTIAAIHAGRKGIRKGIVDNCISVLVKRYGVLPHNILVYIGPHLMQKNHSIFLEDVGSFDKKYYSVLPQGQHVVNNVSLYHKYLSNNNVNAEEMKHKTTVLLNLEHVVTDEFIKNGVETHHIESCGIDTFSDRRFHSYRRDFPDHDLMLNFIGIIE